MQMADIATRIAPSMSHSQERLARALTKPLLYLEDLAIDDMLAIQVRSWHSCDEELAACIQSIVRTTELKSLSSRCVA